MPCLWQDQLVSESISLKMEARIGLRLHIEILNDVVFQIQQLNGHPYWLMLYRHNNVNAV